MAGSHRCVRTRSTRAASEPEQDLLSRERPGWFGVGRPAATIAALGLVPAALELPGLAALALVTAVCCALIAYDVVHYRDERTQGPEARP